MNYFKTRTNKANLSWSPVEPKMNSRFEAPGPESSRPRAPQSHVPQPSVSFNLGALVMFKESFNFKESVSNPQGTPVYCISHISGDTYKLRQTGAEVDLEGWYVGQELRLAAGQNQRRRLRKRNARQQGQMSGMQRHWPVMISAGPGTMRVCVGLMMEDTKVDRDW